MVELVLLLALIWLVIQLLPYLLGALPIILMIVLLMATIAAVGTFLRPSQAPRRRTAASHRRSLIGWLCMVWFFMLVALLGAGMSIASGSMSVAHPAALIAAFTWIGVSIAIHASVRRHKRKLSEEKVGN